MSKLLLKNITKSYGDIKAVRDFHLELSEKSFIVLAGPSGCGKTTLLQLVAGFLTPDSGEIYIDDQLVNQKTPAQRSISMVFQEAALFPHMSVFENITFGLAHSGMKQQDIKEAVYQICEVLGICDLLERKARDLSGGQKQRCAIARALIRKEITKKLKITVIYVTHDQMEAMTLADILIIMKDGEIQQMGNPIAIYQNPINLFTASFLGVYDINQFTAVLAQGELLFHEQKIPWLSEDKNLSVILAVRCEHVIEVSTGGICGSIVLVEQSGEQVYYHIQYEEGVVIMKSDTSHIHQRMENIRFWIDWEYVLLFDACTQNRIYKMK